MVKIDDSMYLSNQPKTRAPSPEMGKNEFLKLLMAQLQNQDPMNPMEDKDFIAQMASFSSLEQMMKMTSSIDKLVQSQVISPVIQYSHMIGKEVSYQDIIDETTGEKGPVKSGNVVAVSQKEGWAILELANGEKIFADSVTKVSDKPGTKPESETI